MKDVNKNPHNNSEKKNFSTLIRHSKPPVILVIPHKNQIFTESIKKKKKKINPTHRVNNDRKPRRNPSEKKHSLPHNLDYVQ